MIVIRCFLFASLAMAAGLAQAANPACDMKAAEVEAQIAHARQNGNEHRQRGLERALANLRANCTDASLIRDIQEDIDDQREDIRELEEDLAEKRAEGRQDKVARIERKLEEERAELGDLEGELKYLQGIAAKP